MFYLLVSMEDYQLENYLTIIFQAGMGSESIAHEASYWLETQERERDLDEELF